MKHLWKLSLVALIAGITMSGCGPKVYTKGEYDDPNRVELLDDKFNEADKQQLAEAIVNAMLACPEIKDAKTPPHVAVSTVDNRTEEHIDIQSINEYIRTRLLKSRKLRFIDRGAREEIESEIEYNKSGRVSKETQKKTGKQIGVDYLMKGSLATNVQEVANDKFIYYVLTMNLVNLETSSIDCTEDKEIRKKYRKRSTGLF